MPNAENNKEGEVQIEQFLSIFIDDFNGSIKANQKGKISNTAALLLCTKTIADVLHILSACSNDKSFLCDDFKKLILDNIGAKTQNFKKAL